MGERAAVDVNNDAVKSFALCLVDGQRIAELERELDKRAGFLFGYVAGFFINVIGERLPLFAADGNEFVVLKAADNDIAVFELFDNARGPVDVIGVVVFVKNDERSFLDGQNFRGGRIRIFSNEPASWASYSRSGVCNSARRRRLMPSATERYGVMVMAVAAKSGG